jgi:hypothetical protein
MIWRPKNPKARKTKMKEGGERGQAKSVRGTWIDKAEKEETLPLYADQKIEFNIHKMGTSLPERSLLTSLFLNLCVSKQRLLNRQLAGKSETR